MGNKLLILSSSNVQNTKARLSLIVVKGKAKGRKGKRAKGQKGKRAKTTNCNFPVNSAEVSKKESEMIFR